MVSERVVIAVDGSAGSDAALDWAVERAASIDIRLEILTIVDLHRTRPEGFDHGLAAHERVVVEAGRRVEASGSGARWSATVHHDRLVPGLAAASRRADLLVMGSHKAVPAFGSIHGTLPLVIASRTLSPLVVVPAGWTPSTGPVVVGVDDGSGAAAADFAAAEAERASTTLVAVRAYELPAAVSRVRGAADALLRGLESAQLSVLDELLSTVRRGREELEIAALVERGRPSLVLAAHAARARLTVIGRHHLHARAAPHLGAVAHDLLMNLPSPVAVVPERAHRELSGSAGARPAEGRRG